jgi:hypothetical protein
VDSAHLDGQDVEDVMRGMEKEKMKRGNGGWDKRKRVDSEDEEPRRKI